MRLVADAWQGNEIVVGFDTDAITVALPPLLAPYPHPAIPHTLTLTSCGLADLAPERRARLGGALYNVLLESARHPDPQAFIDAAERLVGRRVVHWAPMNFSVFDLPDFPRRFVFQCSASRRDGPWDRLAVNARGLGLRRPRLQDALETAIPAVAAAAVAHTAHLALFVRRLRAGVDPAVTPRDPLESDQEQWAEAATSTICSILGYVTGCVVEGSFDAKMPSRYVREALSYCWDSVDRLEALRVELASRRPEPGSPRPTS
jgi:hypothetical protein